ncbi:serine/threonine-protein kinase TBK1-like [Haliotis rubra]|uniref:serine/threonine-protein kinase TBK1-like n=1 Tax=Haliotis rubra TaxID=36100 RepID=UPI001EE5B128|nr:serine/threonine-protein kinase TBK1-like [Haliotis rubra]
MFTSATDRDVERTTTHVYQKKDQLGTGSSCDVYIGLQKGTGEHHALKIFKDAQWARSEERRREVVALQKLKHHNIIKFFGEEEEASTGLTLLVLELCQESLHNFLQEPSQSRGLGDSETLLLVEHLSSAVHYLHRKKYVHRDIKPGNILRHIDNDGSCTYKLSDFGASRFLEEEDLFLSLAGTEEYLHPKVYEKAFVDRGAVICFDSSVDLWSVGCTLYQAVTCQIPFRPHGGVRSNRTIMFQMIAEKPSGSISGYQATEHGQIMWERHIPNTCKLSQPLREQLRTLIAQLLEKDQAHLLSHNEFYQQVKVITHYVMVVVFNAEDVTYVIIYIKPDSSLAEFKDDVAGRTDIMAGDQLLFHRGLSLTDLIGDDVITVACLSCDFREPVILISKNETDSVMREPKPLEPPPTFPSGSVLEKDIHVAHKMAVFLSGVKDRIASFVDTEESMGKADVCMSDYLKKHESRLERTASKLSTKLQNTRGKLELMLDTERKRVQVTSEHNSSISHRCSRVRSSIPKLNEQLMKVTKELSTCKQHTSNHTVLMVHHKCSPKCVEKASVLSVKGRDSWRGMYQRKKCRPMSEFQQLQHTRDRTTMADVCATCTSLYQGHCLPNMKKHMAAFGTRIQVFHSVQMNLLDIRKTLSFVKEQIDDLDATLIQVGSFSGRAWSGVTSQISSLRHGVPLDDGSASLRVMKESAENRNSMEKLLKTLPDLRALPDVFNKFENG